MDNLEQKLNTLCHQNYIGSEKCGGCDGRGDFTKVGDKEFNIDDFTEICPTCKGKGYTIPLEYEALYMPYTEREDPSKYGFKSEEEAWLYIQSNHVCSKIKNEPCESCMAEWIVSKDERPKPLTTTMVLRLLDIKDCWYHNNGMGEISGEKEIEFMEGGKVKVKTIYFRIDLTKDIKDQPEVLQSIIDIVNL